MVEHTMYRFCVAAQFFIWISLGLSVTNRENIQTDCRRRCEANPVYSAPANLFCSADCQLRQCQRGCRLYTEALSSTCQSACASSTPGDQECVRGCSQALDSYAESVKGRLGKLPQPELIRATKKSRSVVLQWSRRPQVPEATYLLQKQVTDAGGDWQVHEHAAFHSNGQISVTQLHPYVTYKFKVLVVVTPTHVCHSPPSIPIVTSAEGAPSSAPTITSLSASSPSVIALAWQPPVFTNGPLLAYRITLNPVGHPELREVTKEVPATATAWTFRQLQSSQRYSVSLAALNKDGQGPAATAHLTTPNPVSITETPFLIIGADDEVLKINVLDIIRLPDTIHSTGQRQVIVTDVERLFGNVTDVQGLGIHVRRQLVLVSGSDGNVHSVNASAGGPGGKRNLYPSIPHPAALTVDWLNDRAYIASKQKIYSCPLDQDTCFAIVTDLPVEPGDVKVDPLNGYLYFSQARQGGGLYRVAISSRARARPGRLERVVASDTLHAFVLDLSSMQLYFPAPGGSSMYSSFLDGTDVTDIRAADQQLDFGHASSIAVYNGTFIWTNGSKTWFDELDQENTRHQNELLLFNKHYCGFNLFHPVHQPIPVPRTMPGQLEVLFTDSLAHVTWQPPLRLQYQGQGAWDQWSYEVEVRQLEGEGEDRRLYSVDALSLDVEQLTPDSRYSLRVRALAHSSSGPWSDPFVGRTFSPEAVTVKALLGLPHAIVEVDIVQQSTQTLVSFPFNPTDIAWHKDLVLWTTSEGELFTFHRPTQQQTRFPGVSDAYCVAYDWLGAKVFWSEPQQGLIKRADVLGSSVDFVYQAAARDLAVDAVAGRLYWATTNSLESSFLDGQDHVVLFSVPYFSGRYVISLTLDLERGRVFWYVKGYQQQDLYSAALIGPAGSNASDALASVAPVGDFRSIARSSGLAYFWERLFWVDQNNKLVVGDLEGNYSAIVNPNNVTTFSIAHPAVHTYPENVSAGEVQVIPHPVKSSEIRVEGPSSSFNLTWPRASEVTHGQVFYKLFVRVGDQTFQKVTTENWHPIKGLSPYTQMAVSLQPYTYWGYSDHTTVSVRSPMSKPSAPLAPRVYVTQHKDALTSEQSLSADFRWSAPAVPNGVLSYYLVFHWEGQNGAKIRQEVPGTARHFNLKPLRANQTFFFQVTACTQVGCGPRSEVATAVTDSVNPVPRLLLAGSEGIKTAEVEERLEAQALVGGMAVTSLAFLARDNVTLWTQAPGKLFSSANTKLPLLELNGTAVDVSLDWVGRALLLAERGPDPGSNRVLAYFLDEPSLHPVLSRPAPILALLTDPFSRSLFWTEEDDSGRGLLYRSDVSGEGGVACLLGPCASGQPSRRRRGAGDGPCSCPRDLDLAAPLALDYSGAGHTRLLFADRTSAAILASDVTGCNCSVIFKPSGSDSQGLPPSLLSVDHLRVYWWRQGQLYSLGKQASSPPQPRSDPLANLTDVLAYGSHLQPLPDYQCLDPGAYRGSVGVVMATNTSLLLSVEPVSRPAQCAAFSLPRDKYTLFYRPLDRSASPSLDPQDCASPTASSSQQQPCTRVDSYDASVLVESLQPFRQYLVQVAVSNYYTDFLAEELGDPHTFSTLPGVPSPARNVTVRPMTPQKLKVEWAPPAFPNGPPEKLHYVISWETRMPDGAYVTDEVRVENLTEVPKKPGFYRHFLQNLQSNLTYTVKVLTGAEGIRDKSESAAVKNRTFPLPGPITLVNATSHSLKLSWQSPINTSILLHHYHVAKMGDNGRQAWELTGSFPVLTRNATRYDYELSPLEPHTRYSVAISAAYRVDPPHTFLWPQDDRYIYSTLSDVPEAPAPPEVAELRSGVHEVSWQPPEDDNGAAITSYLLEYSMEGEGEWQTAYNGSRLQWTTERGQLAPGRYVFRVKAENVNGYGPPSANSAAHLVTPIAENQTIVAVAGSLTSVIVIVLIVVIVAWLVMRRRQKDEKKLRQFVNIVRGPDVELANLRELPHSTVQQSNTLYSINFVPTAEHIARLPHIRRDQLMLVRSLGSGAFGQVFQGLVKDPSSGQSIRVAVKTLRKSADEGEKEEFLKEALLMSNFKHEHILGLMGVCLDNDPQFIIMELMEGRDLLSFMRSCRAQPNTPSILKLPDLVKICVHVARGCKYLEENHFVHRDLAARNCLVSSKDPLEMIVKIGDFGLARDIYKNDYYRKEGEGMLPVRWMSPESLVDGVFTTHSDIWAFGVLMWEVVTFGQQPYPARTNIEVLHYVRAGGKLERPDKCPDDIFHLMERCWSLNPEDRPPFAAILQALEGYAEKCSLMTPAQIQEASPSGTDEVRERGTSSQQDVAETVSTPRRWFHRTVGGSVRLTPTSKKKRLLSLLGQNGPEHEKLVVEQPGSGRMKRTSSASLECGGGRVSYSQVLSFPRVAQLDSLGYLEPRAKHAPYYLQLIDDPADRPPSHRLAGLANGHARGAGEGEEGGTRGAGRDRHPSTSSSTLSSASPPARQPPPQDLPPSARGGYERQPSLTSQDATPSLSSRDRFPSSSSWDQLSWGRQPSVSSCEGGAGYGLVGGKAPSSSVSDSGNPYSPLHRAGGRGYGRLPMTEPPPYPSPPDSAASWGSQGEGGSQEELVGSRRGPLRSTSSSQGGGGEAAAYYCAECYNQRCLDHGPQQGRPNLHYSRVNEAAMCSDLPDPPEPRHQGGPPPAWPPGGHPEASRSLSGPAGYGRPGPEYVNSMGSSSASSSSSSHPHPGRSRNQVFPENVAALAGYDIAQASLV